MKEDSAAIIISAAIFLMGFTSYFIWSLSRNKKTIKFIRKIFRWIKR
ncbi:Uncharacterised protein [uncultured archaeon]|nr:Uncharacterised protein [uncultured archaeon]